MMAPALLNDAGNITLGRDDQWNMGARSRPRNSYQGASSYSYALIIISPRLLIWIMISRYLSPWCGHPGAVNKERLGLAKDFNQERNSRKNLGNSPADQSGPKHDLTEGSTTASGLRKGKLLYEKEHVMHRTHTSKVQLKMAREK